jgi:hypothetical protein
VERVTTGLQDRERETMARRTGETLALLAALDALARSAPPAVVEAYARHRFSGLSGRNYGEPIPSKVAEALLDRSLAVPS